MITPYLAMLIAAIVSGLLIGMMHVARQKKLPAWSKLYRSLWLIYIGILVGCSIGSYLQ